jgi:hypothetical protein
MSGGTNAFPAKAGFNQSGGGYFMCIQPLETNSLSLGGYINTISVAPTGSGGATVPPTLALVSMSSILGLATTSGSTLVATGKLLKDMGRTVVSAGRTFRKFAPVVQALGANNTSSFGIIGTAATTTNAGYGAFYLEVGRDGSAASQGTGAGAPAPIARYF